MERITSVKNEHVKRITKIMSSAKERRYSGKYLVEGPRMVREIPINDLDEIFFTQDFFNNHIDDDSKLLRLVNQSTVKKKCYIVSDAVLRKLSQTDKPQGVVALVNIHEYKLDDILTKEPTPGSTVQDSNPMILIVERLQDPGNMGSIIRSAEGAGVSGILVSYDSVDIYSPKVVRATMGAIFRKKIVITYDLIGDIAKLKEAGITVYGMHLEGKSVYDLDLTGPSAFMVGNEGNGLSQEVTDQADKLLRIPMLGELESLNAASSATIVSYEALRQRLANVDMMFL